MYMNVGTHFFYDANKIDDAVGVDVMFTRAQYESLRHDNVQVDVVR